MTSPGPMRGRNMTVLHADDSSFGWSTPWKHVADPRPRPSHYRPPALVHHSSAWTGRPWGYGSPLEELRVARERLHWWLLDLRTWWAERPKWKDLP